MFKRKINKNLFNGNVFLLGPRKVGKSTFLKETFTNSIYIDLLDNDLYFEYTTHPGSFYQNIKFQIAQNPDKALLPIVVDEIQRIPILLNDIHRLIESDNLNFILCGSSARKLVRGGANMLGGRASRIEMRGLSINEIPDFNLLTFINSGGIPSHYLSNESETNIKSYIQNYIQEEVIGEALVRNLLSFNRFLELVGITNSEEVNYTNIARDVGVDAKTVKEYFQILIDTLIGSYLNPYFDRTKRINLSKSPKFYLFDTGLANHLKGISLQKEGGSEFGKSFEHMIYNEIVNYRSYTDSSFKLAFWRTYEKEEVDFILGDAEVAIEVKGGKNIHSSEISGLIKFKDIYSPRESLVVCNCTTPKLLENGVKLIPYLDFVNMLWAGEIVR